MKNQTEMEKIKDQIEELVVEVILSVLLRLKNGGGPNELDSYLKKISSESVVL